MTDAISHRSPRRGWMPGAAAHLIAVIAAMAGLLALLPAATVAAAPPRFMVLIDEKNVGAYQMDEAEKVISEYLLSKDLPVVDPELVRTKLDRDRALQAMASGPAPAAALGLQFGAEVILVGKAVAKGSADTVKDTSFRSYQASVSLKAIRTDTAEVLAAESREAAKIHVDDVAGGTAAIREASAPLIAALIPKVLAKWGGGAAGEACSIEAVVGDVTQVWQVVALKELLRGQIAGVQEVVQRSYVSGVAVFSLRATVDAQALAEELTLADPGGFRIKVLSITPGKLDLRLVE